jgi:hypothetical protein
LKIGRNRFDLFVVIGRVGHDDTMTGKRRGYRADIAKPVFRRDVVIGLAAGGLAGASSIESEAAAAPRGREGRILLKNAIVLSLEPNAGDSDRADVLVEGRTVAAVRPDIQTAATAIDTSLPRHERPCIGRLGGGKP